MITTPRSTTVPATGTATSDFALSRFMKGEEFAMKKTLKAVIAMILVLALGFAVAAPVFAASASTVAQSASIRDFFKKIGDSIKKFLRRSLSPRPSPTRSPMSRLRAARLRLRASRLTILRTRATPSARMTFTPARCGKKN